MLSIILLCMIVYAVRLKYGYFAHVPVHMSDVRYVALSLCHLLEREYQYKQGRWLARHSSFDDEKNQLHAGLALENEYYCLTKIKIHPGLVKSLLTSSKVFGDDPCRPTDDDSSRMSVTKYMDEMCENGDVEGEEGVVNIASVSTYLSSRVYGSIKHWI